MKREETYCDCCGKQMTTLSANGNQDWEGVRLSPDNKDDASVIHVSMSKVHSCGTSDKAEWLHGREFCSFECFHDRAVDWLDRCRGFWK